MSTITFDTLAYAKRLKKVGFTEEQAEEQAETLVSVIDEQMASSRDLKELEISLKRDLKELELATKRDLKEMELRLTHTLTLRLGTMLVVGISAVAALVKIL
jgi:hypothetical protein